LPAFLKGVRDACEGEVPGVPQHFLFKSIETPYIKEYGEIFPEMRFIHLIRHPFTNYSSMKRTLFFKNGRPFWYLGGDDLHTFLEMRWIPHATFAVSGCRPENDRHYLVRYEDLCARPTDTVNDICRWLQVTPPVDPTLQTVLGGKQMRELPTNASKKGVKTPVHVVADMSKKFNYEDVLTGREKGLIAFRTYNLARQLGYFTEGEEQIRVPGRLELVRKWLFPDRWEIMNSYFYKGWPLGRVISWLRLIYAFFKRRYWIFRKLML
jgi:hypothetical protein